MNTYLVEYKDSNAPWCTNVAQAECEFHVWAYYFTRHDRAYVAPRKPEKPYPVVECPPDPDFENYFDRHDCDAEVLDSHHDAESGNDYDLVSSEGDLFVVTNASGDDYGCYLFYKDMVCWGNNREVLMRWHELVS